MNTPMQPLQQSNVPQSSNNVLHSSRTRVHTHVVTLERVQQSSTVLPQHFNVQEVARQQHPRFYESDQGLLPFYHLHADVECIRGALESSWDLTPTTTTAPAAPSPHKAQLQRLKRAAAARGDHTITHAAPGAPSGLKQQDKRRSRDSSSAKSAPQDAAGSSASSAAAAAGASAFGDQQSDLLKVLMNLWHLHTNHDGMRINSSMGYTIPLPQAPRMLTADEERALATIIQQNRKLQQIASQDPATAAAVLGTTTTSSSRTSSSSSRTPTTSRTSSSSSSYKQPQYKDKRHRWPPLLTAADVAEVSALPVAWRAILPSLAAQAQQLLVAFNTGLVLFMLRRARRVADVPEDDLVSSGLAGLRLAASRFDPSKGTRFSTVASMWIAQHISRSSVAEAGRAMRRPEHHLQMVRHVAQHYGTDALRDIERHPDMVKQVAAHFKSKPSAVVAAIRDTLTQHTPTSLEALATSTASSKADGNSTTAWANLLTTTDLDEDSDVLRGSGQEGSMSGGVGTLLAAAGQIPTWAQASMRVQQEVQQGADAGFAAAAAGGAAAAAAPGAAAASGESVAAAAAKLVQLAASTASPAASVTGTMLDTIDDVGGSLESNMQSMLQVLTPLEQQVISVLYGLDQDVTAGLGVELPPSALGSVSSSTGAEDGGSTSSTSSRGRGRPPSKSGTDSTRGRGRQSSSSTAGRDPAGDDVRMALGRNPKVLQAAKSSRGVISLKQAAVQLGFSSHQLVANVRNQALGKLVAATRQASAATAGSGGSAAGVNGQLPAAGEGVGVGAVGSSSSSSWEEDPAAAATAAAAVVAPPTYTGVRTIELIELMRQYVQEHGRLPQRYNERYKGTNLYSWMQRLRTRYWKGKVSAVVVATIEEAVPIWDWGEPREPAAAADAAAADDSSSSKATAAAVKSSSSKSAAAAAVKSSSSKRSAAAVKSSSKKSGAVAVKSSSRKSAAVAVKSSSSKRAAAAAADAGSSTPAAAAGVATAAAGSSSVGAAVAASRKSSSTPAAAAAATAAGGSESEPAARRRSRRTNLELVQLLQQYVQEHGQLPHAPRVFYKGSYLFNWMQRLRASYRKGMVSPVVIQALQEGVPMWTWHEAPSMVTAAIAAAAAAALNPAGGSSSSRRSSGSIRRSSSRRGKQQG